ncbi:MAG: 30S ribosomal protein S12 methylthiotransferase RimO [candidate division KSB1 bacterium]|nr:30S ribosomal protein S12 methylthiotransferase RimO [candidate division KSB1 bacterium]MDZ7303556.1 30S ribosomal protein S12 methylthiotransferase RimO [candidate division KSB1 bacterium]MDZ7312799.1 30S ribosomal protein S12 methylthiotransferase RimO [candidate division KSB1 bacterium]
MKINLITLGCPKNIVDSEIIKGGLKAGGVEFVDDINGADTVIINTCGFIESAKEESIDTILQAVQLKKHGQIKKVYVTGCLSERYGKDLRREIPEVDAFYGNRDLGKVVAGIARQLRLKYELIGERELLTPKHYAYLKISEGCEHPCSFCAIPAIRGSFRSTPIPALVAEAARLAEKGVKELILIAQDTTQYGLDLDGRKQLPELLRALCQVDGIEWMRLMYAYPYHVTDAMLEVVASEPKIVKYLDLPIQHISSRVLKRMARRVDRKYTEELLARMRAMIPELALRTSVIVGFPGETEEDFQELLDFVAEGNFERLGVFGYSQEENTPAFRFPDQVPEEVKRERCDLLMQAQQQVSAAWSASQVGRRLRILIDELDPTVNAYRGRTAWDCPEIDHTVLVSARQHPVESQGKNSRDVNVGEFCEVDIVAAQDYDLIAIPTRRRNSRSSPTPTRRHGESKHLLWQGHPAGMQP